MPQRQIFRAAFRGGKTQRLAAAAGDALAAGVQPGQLLGLAVHQPAANRLRETLAAVAGQPIATATLRGHALMILTTFPAAAQLPVGWQPSALLSGIDRRLLIRQAWFAAADGPDSLLAQRGAQPGALDWITRLFDRFSSWCDAADPQALPALRMADAPLAELWRAYRGYLALCQRHGVVAFGEVFNRAADALREREVRRATARRVILLDDLDLCRPEELRFVAALTTARTDLFAACTVAPDPDSPVAGERWAAEWAARLRMRVSDAAAAETPPALTIGEYLAPEMEAHAIAQRIAAYLQRQPASARRYSSCAVIAFDQELRPLLERILPQYGLPVEGQAGRDGYVLGIAPLALLGLKLLAEETPTLAETIAFLRHPALGLSGGDAHAAVEAVETRRWSPFTEEGRSLPQLSAMARERLRQVRSVTAVTRVAAQPPSVALRSWLAVLDLEARVWEQTERALEPWAVAVDRRHWELWLRFLEQSEALRAALGAPLTPTDALEVFSSAQALIEREGWPHADAVQIWSPDALGGCTASLVCVAGLHEGALPLPLPPLPLADDAALRAAFGALPGFAAPQIGERAAAWARGRHELARALSRAGAAAHLSYSRTDRQERRRLPSPVLAAALGGQIDRHGQLHLPPDSAPIERQPLADAGGAHAALGRRPLQLAGAALIELPLPVLADQAFDESPFRVSPSAIEDYFTCPRRCYYARELDLYDVASSPRQALGMVVHSALDALLRERPGAPLDEAQAEALVARYWLDDEQRWGSRLRAAVFRRLAVSAVLHLARYESERGGAAMFLGGELAFEWPLPGADVVIAGRIDRIDRTADGLEVIDYKLGRHSPSIAALLAEFVPPREASGWRPGDIQLPVYALAIEQGTVVGLERGPDERVARVALVYPLELYSEGGRASARGRRAIEIIDHAPDCAACEGPPPSRAKVGTLWRKQLADVAALVGEAVAAMRAGRWQADPREGSQTCASCPFRPICSQPH